METVTRKAVGLELHEKVEDVIYLRARNKTLEFADV